MSDTNTTTRTDTGSSADQVVGAPLRQRLRRWRPFLAAGALLLVVTLATLWASPRTSKVPYAIDNPHADGTRALAQLLRDEGVSVSSVNSADAAIQAAADGATVVVLSPSHMSHDDRWQLAQAGGDVVVLGTLYEDLDGLTDLTGTGDSAAADTLLQADCTDPDATAAASLAGSTGSISLENNPHAIGCFPVAEGSYAYATAPLDGGGTLRLVADPRIATNANLTTEGNAALMIRALGHHERLVWFDASRATTPALWDSPLLPPWLPVLMLLGVGLLGALAVVRGRRFGRIVAENLPVVVHASETAVGRGRLYRKAGDRERAAQALRAGAALRLGRRLGLPASASRGELIEAAARASQWPPTIIDQALYGPIPADDHALADLAVRLEQLESEVHSR
ncbi:DUF4350 domain-containing protein [Actinomyces sp. MRS3W]|uniref:DUF4350 domain-containing protein n=1 Tax=Actinomyces sp. MRS3W TaxID=2800796 RepID=UPI0028FD9D82|nr:DUF4350 domain-containing protein [Actinomyces sp. MRS3W]MDU0349552.1 DUF4350 domain-containing protein [Actinomyces sp. MRS3W]